MRLILDTDVIVAGMRSPSGASAALLVLILKHQATLLLSVAMAFEYEATCLRPEHLTAARASEADASNLIDALIGVAHPVEVHYQWRPQLNDPDDDMILEAAVNGGAEAIVTFNRKDFGDIPARFGITALSPAEALKRLRE